MSGIRPFERSDVPRVAALYEQVRRSGARAAPAWLGERLARVFLDHPWADTAIPSLIAQEADGRIVGFIGSSVRRLRFDGRPITLACSGPLLTDPAVRQRAVGAFLLHRYLSGPQELTITDGATAVARRMWEGLGGETAELRCVRWVRVFRPLAALSDRGRRSRRSLVATVLRPLGRVLDAAITRAPRTPFRASASPARAEPLTPERLLEHLPSVVGALRLYPDYDRPSLDWLFAALREMGGTDEPAAVLVRAAAGDVLGWYVYLLRRGGTSRVLQVAARDGHADAVLEHLLAHAWRSGAAALVGRLEPSLLAPLAGRRCVLYSRADALTALVHSRHPELLHAIASQRSLLTRLEGESWFDFQCAAAARRRDHVAVSSLAGRPQVALR